MAANVESMAYARVVPWHGLGVHVEQAMTSAEALELAGLNWDVEQRPIYFPSVVPEGLVEGQVVDDTYVKPVLQADVEIPNYFANIRTSDNSCLGVVSKAYKIVQNKTAFAFTDAVIGSGRVRYETAGSLNGGKRVWMLARLGDRWDLMGDKMESYLCFSNGHDGYNAVRACITTVRVVCENTLTLAIDSTPRAWGINHTGDITGKIQEAQKTLFMADEYISRIPEVAELLASINVYPDEEEKLMDALFPLDPDAGKVAQNNVQVWRTAVKKLTGVTDLKPFEGTAWAWYQATSDAVTHLSPFRKAPDRSSLFANSVVSTEGHPVINRAQKVLAGFAQ